MFKFQLIQKYLPGIPVLFAAVVTLSSSETAKALIAAFGAVINGQPQGF